MTLEIMDVQSLLTVAAASAIFSVGGAWATMRVSLRALKDRLDRIEKWRDETDEDMETAKHSRNVTRACISALIDTVQDPARKRMLEIMWAAANSPVVIQYEPLRALVESRGRPPEHVIEGIRKIAALEPKDDIEVLAYVNMTFTPEQLARAAHAHATDPEHPSRADFNELCRLFFADVRERGVEVCLKDAGLVD